jgi:two-component system chemotaxis response regulator CheY
MGFAMSGMRLISPNTSSAPRLNILVVDDEVGTRTALAIVLQLAGHKATFAKDGDEALDLFDAATVPFDLIITDHQMVRVSGIDLVRRLREKGFHGEIVVLTAYAGTIEEEEYRKLEVAGIMEKPFDIAELREWLGCIHESREKSRAGGIQDGPPHAISFCWLKRP